MSPSSGLPTVEDVLRFHSEGIKHFGGTPGTRQEDNPCIDGAIGAALQAAYILAENDRIDPLHLASYLLYYIARKNCFIDGNKRAAWYTFTDYLLRNGIEVCASTDEAESLVKGIAKGEVTKEQVIDWLAGPGRLEPSPETSTENTDV